MLKRKRHNKDDSDDTEDDELITVHHNKITFYCDINYKSCFELIKAIDNVKSKIRSERVSEYEEEKPKGQTSLFDPRFTKKMFKAQKQIFHDAWTVLKQK